MIGEVLGRERRSEVVLLMMKGLEAPLWENTPELDRLAFHRLRDDAVGAHN
jgi:hypothetical protein